MDVDQRLVPHRHEQLPIVLHQISEEDFTYFLNWVYHILYIIEWLNCNSIKFTIDGLENLALQPTCRLELAWLYSIPQWIAPAICEIILLSLVNTTDTKAAQMGFKLVQGGMVRILVEESSSCNPPPNKPTPTGTDPPTHH
ncbi:uncharacterized protein BJ212DRAFT_1294713 [Suillus subaureus]|uniref:Uncharacterized protein n=1 Tax=Suillus subaureus TaxID=48587 RepID=A0A9P7EP66_9AGAM|nr:uncharacterized protein BJ212DRAFT_1294713 [Suillus subaureus]KAG1827437.1 hypothetical protein BJ212DRAFT_1294713 [Suillus subaureus]